MHYDFDTVVDRANAPYSYAAKWSSKGMMVEMMKKMMGFNDVPEDRLCFFTADMDFKCAPELTEALVKTAEHGIFGYSSVPAEYYEAICRWFRDRFDWEFDPSHIFLCSQGTHYLVAECIKTYTQPGDGVIVLLPSYSYHADIEPLGRHQVGLQMFNDGGYYTIDFNAFEKACAEEKNTLFIMMQPHNPTGRVFTVEEMNKLAEICRKYNVVMVSDEVHIDIARKGQKVVPFMKAVGPQGVITATAVNKTFNVAGLAMSNLIIEDDELRAKYPAGFPMSNPFGITAVITAYTKCDAWVDALNEYLDKILTYTCERFKKDLPKAKFVMPEGTYVLWVDFSGYGLSDEELAKKINDTHVLVGEGSGFDAINGKQIRRFCLTAPMVQIEDMCNRLAKAFEGC